MGRRKGFDGRKIAGIVGVLARNPDGLWLRQVAKELDISPTTVSKYMDGPLKPLVDDTSLGKTGKPILRVIRLKPFVLERLRQGQDINQILKFLRIIGESAA